MRKKIYVIGSAGIPARYGGFETFAENFSKKLASKHDITVVCSNKYYDRSELSKTWNSIHRIFLPLKPNGFQSILYDLLSLTLCMHKADKILLLGSGIGSILPLLSKRIRLKIWMHIDGLEWKRSKWNVFIRKYLQFNYTIGIRFAGRIIIDNEALVSYIPKKFHFKIIRSGYGGDHLPKLKNSKLTFSESYALVIARAEPENNLELILRCFLSLNSIHLVVISNWQHTRYGQFLKNKYAYQPALSLIGPIFNDPEKLQSFRLNCSLYIHGHSAGGTNPSLVEAMFSGVPIFAFDNEFNRRTTHNYAFFFSTYKELSDLLKKRNTLDLKASAQKLQDYASEFHTWNRAVLEFEQALAMEEKDN